MPDMIIRIVLSMIVVAPCALLSLSIKELGLPSKFQRNTINIWDDPERYPENLVCWNGPVPDRVCKTLFQMSNYICSDNYCATMVPKGNKPDTGICVSSMSEAPSGFIIDKEYGTCSPNPNTRNIFISLTFTTFLLFNILFCDISWIIG